MRLLIAGWVLAASTLAACSPQPVPLPAGERGLAGRMGFRQLYRTPRAYIYAADEATADWMGSYLDRQLGEIERRCGVRLDPGLVVALAAGESLASRRPGSKEPHLGMAPAVDLTEEDTQLLLGVPPCLENAYSWCCAVPTDGFLKEAVSRYFKDFDRKHPNAYFLDDSPITRIMYRGLMRPAYRSRYVGYGRDQRRYVLGRAAIAHSAMEADKQAAALEVMKSVYEQKYARSRDALARFD